MTENVISFSSRKPLAQQIAEDIQRAEEENLAQAERDEAFISLQLEILDQVRERIASGEFTGLVIVSRNQKTGAFMQDLLLHPDFVRSSEMFGLVGMLECLKLELADVATMAPTHLANGELLDAYAEGVEDDEYPEGEEW